MNARIDRLRTLVDGPLLVTNLVNVRYLTGFDSSNAAVLVEPDRVRVFADFRYAEQGRHLQGAEFVEVSRNLVAALAQQLSGRILFEADHVTYAAWETLRAGGLELVPTTGLTLGLRAVKEPEELDAIRRAAAITDRAYEAPGRAAFAGRTERDLAWTMEQLLHEEGAEALAFPIIVASGPNAANPHTVPGDRRLQDGDIVIVDAGARFGRVLLRLHADVRRRRPLQTGSPTPTSSPTTRSSRDCRRSGRGSRARPPTPCRAASSTRPSSRAPSATGSATASGWTSTRRRRCGRSRATRWRRERRLGRAGDLPPRRGRGADRGPRRGHGGRLRAALALPQGAATGRLESARVAEVVSTNQFRNGMHIELDGSVWRIVEFQHVKPGKGGAFVRTKVKSLDSGSVVDRTFRAGEKFPRCTPR